MVVWQALQLVAQGRNLPDALATAGLAQLTLRDRAFARRLALHTVRHQRRLQLDMAAYLKHPLKDAETQALLCLGAAQIELPDIPEHAAVHSTVELAPPRMRGFLNALLRRRLREPPSARDSWGELHSFPEWLVSAIKRDWPGQALPILQALNEEPIQCLRINRQKVNRQQWLQALGEDAAIESLGDNPGQADGLVSLQHRVVAELPGFAEGQVSVQGASAQATAGLLNLQPGQQVLDACCAPGGKTAHMLEIQPDLQCVAMDVDEQRLQRVEENLQRLGLSAQTKTQDVMTAQFPEAQFDRILLDVPCSGTGVIGRHPDIKWLRRESDIPSFVEQQLALLQQVWPWLKPGGQLLYCTCSILSAENDGVVAAFVVQQMDAKADPLNLPFGQASEYGWRVAPQSPYEGFYFSRLIKKPLIES